MMMRVRLGLFLAAAAAVPEVRGFSGCKHLPVRDSSRSILLHMSSSVYMENLSAYSAFHHDNDEEESMEPLTSYMDNLSAYSAHHQSTVTTTAEQTPVSSYMDHLSAYSAFQHHTDAQSTDMTEVEHQDVMVQQEELPPTPPVTAQETPSTPPNPNSIIDLGTAIQMAYDASDKTIPFDEFKANYAEDAIRYYKAAQAAAGPPPDLQTAIELAYEYSDKHMGFDEFKANYAEEAIKYYQALKMIQAGNGDSMEAPSSASDDVPPDMHTMIEMAYEASDKSIKFDYFKSNYAEEAIKYYRAVQDGSIHRHTSLSDEDKLIKADLRGGIGLTLGASAYVFSLPFLFPNAAAPPLVASSDTSTSTSMVAGMTSTTVIADAGAGAVIPQQQDMVLAGGASTFYSDDGARSAIYVPEEADIYYASLQQQESSIMSITGTLAYNAQQQPSSWQTEEPQQPTQQEQHYFYRDNSLF